MMTSSVRTVGRKSGDRKAPKRAWLALLVLGAVLVGGVVIVQRAWQEADWLCQDGQSRVGGICLMPKSSDPADYLRPNGAPLAAVPSDPPMNVPLPVNAPPLMPVIVDPVNVGGVLEIFTYDDDVRSFNLVINQDQMKLLVLQQSGRKVASAAELPVFVRVSFAAVEGMLNPYQAAALRCVGDPANMELWLTTAERAYPVTRIITGQCSATVDETMFPNGVIFGSW